MRTYNELRKDEKEEAHQIALNELLTAIVEGAVRFDDAANGDDLQARIDAACIAAEDMQTPWFSGDYIMDTCRQDLESIAFASAEDALYSGPSERVIRLP